MHSCLQRDLCYRCFLSSRCTPWRLYFLQHYFLLERRLHLGERCSARGHHSLLFVLVGPFLLQSESLRLAEERTSCTVNQTRINVYSVNSKGLFTTNNSVTVIVTLTQRDRKRYKFVTITYILSLGMHSPLRLIHTE